MITARYDSPLGGILLAGCGEGLSGLWFDGQRYFACGLEPESRPGSLPVLDETRRWLDVYFSGREPDFMPALCPRGTPFRAAVWERLRRIPYGAVTTYGALAAELARQGLHTSARAVGGAVGHNPISILIPCHRVLAADGALTGYAGGLEKKNALLSLEGADRFCAAAGDGGRTPPGVCGDL